MSIDLELFFQGMAEATLLLDRKGNISASNQAFEKQTGYSFLDIKGQAYTSLTHHAPQLYIHKEPLLLAVDRGLYEYVVQFLKKDYTLFTAKARIEPILTLNGDLTGFRYSISDLSDQQNHLDQNELYKLMIEGVQDYSIYLTDSEGYIQSWNAGASLLKGFSKEEIIGQHYSILYNDEDRLAEKPFQDLEMTKRNGTHEKKTWRRKKDGTLFWAHVVITALYNAFGELVGFSNVTQDISDHKRDSELLTESAEKYRSLVQQVTDYGIFMLDENGVISSWNEGAQKIKGYTPEEIIGKHFSIFYPNEDILADKPANELIIAQMEGKYEEEGWRIRKDGSQFWANVVITAVYNPSKKLIGYSKVTRDLTERKRSEERLRESFEKYRELAEKFKAANIELSIVNKELEQFTATVSHDLLEPLRTAKSFLYLVTTKLNENNYDELHTYINKSVLAVDKMKGLIDSLLNYAWISKGEIEKKPLNTAELIQQVLSNLNGTIKNTGARINLHINAQTITGDSTQLMLLIQNLLSNALKFIDSRVPDINIKVEEHNDFVKFAVQDNGIGIESDALKKVFDVFRRLHTTNEYPGTGIGLALCKKIVERHEGRIWIESEKGIGSTFFFTIGENMSTKE